MPDSTPTDGNDAQESAVSPPVPVSFETPAPISSLERLAATSKRGLRRCAEYLRYQSALAKGLTRLIGPAGVCLLRRAGKYQSSLSVLRQIHYASRLGTRRTYVDNVLQKDILAARQDPPGPRGLYLANALDQIRMARGRSPQDNFKMLLGSRMIVLKTYRPSEKGVILFEYTNYFLQMLKMLDFPRLQERYRVVLDPSWCGYAILELLAYATRAIEPMLILSNESADTRLIENVSDVFASVPLAPHCWVDPRVFCPTRPTEQHRDIDVFMNATWAKFKRHEYFFRVLAKLRRRGRKLSVTLVGYPGDRSIQDIRREAILAGVADQIQFYENITPEQINLLLNRSKVNVLWSLREGANRALLEAMLADVPSILHEGYNFGEHYSYINEHTGCFATERNLPETLLRLIDRKEQLHPRQWAMENRSCHWANRILSEYLRNMAQAAGEDWTEDTAIRIGYLSTSKYYHPEDRARFTADYEYIRDHCQKLK